MNLTSYVMAWSIFFILLIIACVVLHKKNRGWGFYVLAVVWPLVGLIVACLVNDKSKEEEHDSNNKGCLAILWFVVLVIGLQKCKQDTDSTLLGYGTVTADSGLSPIPFLVQNTIKINHLNIGAYTPPSSWSTFQIDNALFLSIPPSMELRSDFDLYTKYISSHQFVTSNAEAIFQQKGLSSISSAAKNSYCRILVYRLYVGDDEAPAYYEMFPLSDIEDQLKDRAIEEAKPATLINEPTYNWIDINGTKGIEVSYIRTGLHGNVVGHIYYFNNYNETVRIVTAYRESDESMWKETTRNVIRTFRWVKAK